MREKNEGSGGKMRGGQGRTIPRQVALETVPLVPLLMYFPITISPTSSISLAERKPANAAW